MLEEIEQLEGEVETPRELTPILPKTRRDLAIGTATAYFVLLAIPLIFL